MKLKNILLTLTAFVLLVSSGRVIAQSDSVNIHYAYVHFYSEDTYTEYISSVFCWHNNSSNKSPTYPGDTLTRWAKAIFKTNFPDIKVRRCVCKFMRSDSSFYTSAEQATKSWNAEMNESKEENITIVVVSFPDCMKK
jgi:hypothetical protein